MEDLDLRQRTQTMLGPRSQKRYLRTPMEFQTLVESVPNALVMMDDQGRIVLVNHQVEVLFGYSRLELLG